MVLFPMAETIAPSYSVQSQKNLSYPSVNTLQDKTMGQRPTVSIQEDDNSATQPCSTGMPVQDLMAHCTSTTPNPSRHEYGEN